MYHPHRVGEVGGDSFFDPNFFDTQIYIIFVLHIIGVQKLEDPSGFPVVCNHKLCTLSIGKRKHIARMPAQHAVHLSQAPLPQKGLIFDGPRLSKSEAARPIFVKPQGL